MKNSSAPIVAEKIINKDLKKTGTSWERIKAEVWTDWGGEKVQLCRPQAAWCCNELLAEVTVLLFSEVSFYNISVFFGGGGLKYMFYRLKY